MTPNCWVKACAFWKSGTSFAWRVCSKLLQFAYLTWAQLQELSHHLQRSFLAARLNFCGLQLLENLVDIKLREIGRLSDRPPRD